MEFLHAFYANMTQTAMPHVHGIISTNNIVTGMVHGGHKYAFNSPKVHFHPTF
jgi:hypothetical protein